MRETRLYGSVRGAAGNNRPYREHMQRSKTEFNHAAGGGEQCGRHTATARF